MNPITYLRYRWRYTKWANARAIDARTFQPLTCNCGKPAVHGLGLGTKHFILYCDTCHADWLHAWKKR